METAPFTIKEALDHLMYEQLNQLLSRPFVRHLGKGINLY